MFAHRRLSLGFHDRALLQPLKNLLPVDLTGDDGLLELIEVGEAQLLDAGRVLLKQVAKCLEQLLGVNFRWLFFLILLGHDDFRIELELLDVLVVKLA